MSFESISRNAQASQKRIVIASPDALRECADRLDHASKAVRHGESVICDLTNGITVIFKPDRSSSEYESSGCAIKIENKYPSATESLKSIHENDAKFMREGIAEGILP